MCRVPVNILKKAVAVSRKGLVLRLGVWRGLITPHREKVTCYDMANRASDLLRSFGTTLVTENGHDTWHSFLNKGLEETS